MDAIHKDLILPVTQHTGHNPGLVPPDLSEGGLILNSDFVANGKFCKNSTSFVKCHLHFVVEFCCQDLTFFSF